MKISHLVLVAGLGAIVPSGAQAQTFDVRFAGRIIGELSATPTAISTQLTNTPLGAADGWFEARREAQIYRATNSAGRRIEIAFDAGTVTSVIVAPVSERTSASNPASVPRSVLDPIRGFAQLVAARDCPEAFTMYDGRRVIQVSTRVREVTGASLLCRIDYRVSAGPGHVAPFRISQLSLTAHYDLEDARVTGLSRLDMRAGPFAARLQRR